MVGGLAAVANDVHATNHLTNGEESKDLGGGDTEESNLLGVGVADAVQHALGGGHLEVLNGGRVAHDVDQRLEVGLEGGHGTVRWRSESDA